MILHMKLNLHTLEQGAVQYKPFSYNRSEALEAQITAQHHTPYLLRRLLYRFPLYASTGKPSNQSAGNSSCVTSTEGP